VIDEQELFEMGTRAPARDNRPPEDVIRRGRRYGRRRLAAQAGGGVLVAALLVGVAGSLADRTEPEAVVAAEPDGTVSAVPADSPTDVPAGTECHPHVPAGTPTPVYATPEEAVDAFRSQSTAPDSRWELSTGDEMAPDGSRVYVNRELAGEGHPEPVTLLVSPKDGGWTVAAWQRTDC
jgi:hypothetical protein